jgi:hypothetical protein
VLEPLVDFGYVPAGGDLAQERGSGSAAGGHVLHVRNVA